MVINGDLRYLIAHSAYKAGGGHIPSCFSCIDLINSLYELFNIATDKKFNFVLSKGHAALSLYSVLFKYGLIKREDLINLNKKGSSLGGHPDAAKVPNVLFNTGSLGHGLPCSLGYATALKKIDHKIFCMIGDGECNEGTTWESAAIANSLKVGNLTVIVDFNKSTNNVLPFFDITKIWKSFGWDVIEIDGHDLVQIENSLKASVENKDKPTVIIANTIKGFGIPFMENNGTWHYRCPSEDEMCEIKKILGVDK